MSKIDDMTVFGRVVEEGGFSAAAQALGLTPSGVSKVVSRLEDRLGVRLLNRTTRRLSLTEAGEGYFQRVQSILSEIEEAEAAVSEARDSPRGTLRVTVAASFATAQIVPIIPDFLARYPELRLEICLSDTVIDLVETGFDLAIRMGGLRDSTLMSRKLADNRRLICAAPAYIERHGRPETPADLAKHTCVTASAPNDALNTWPFAGPNGRQEITVAGRVEANNGEILHQMAVAGLGIARMAEFVAGPDIKAGRLVSLLDEFHQGESPPLYAVYAHRRHLPAKVRAFIDFLVERFTPKPPWCC